MGRFYKHIELMDGGRADISSDSLGTTEMLIIIKPGVKEEEGACLSKENVKEICTAVQQMDELIALERGG